MFCAFTRPRYQVSVYTLVYKNATVMDSLEIIAACDLEIG